MGGRASSNLGKCINVTDACHPETSLPDSVHFSNRHTCTCVKWKAYRIGVPRWCSQKRCRVTETFLTPARSWAGTTALILFLSPSLSPRLLVLLVLFPAGFSVWWAPWVFILSRERTTPGKVWGLPFIGSPLTCGQGNGMSSMLTCSRATLSFTLKKLQLCDSPPLPPAFPLEVPQ